MLERMESESEFFTLSELAIYLKLVDAEGNPKRQSLYWLRTQTGGPPAIRIGGRRGRLLFRKTAVAEWLAARTEPVRP